MPPATKIEKNMKFDKYLLKMSKIPRNEGKKIFDNQWPREP